MSRAVILKVQRTAIVTIDVETAGVISVEFEAWDIDNAKSDLIISNDEAIDVLHDLTNLSFEHVRNAEKARRILKQRPWWLRS